MKDIVNLARGQHSDLAPELKTLVQAASDGLRDDTGRSSADTTQSHRQYVPFSSSDIDEAEIEDSEDECMIVEMKCNCPGCRASRQHAVQVPETRAPIPPPAAGAQKTSTVTNQRPEGVRVRLWTKTTPVQTMPRENAPRQAVDSGM